MTFRQLTDDCWRDLPPLRKWAAGRNAVNKLLSDAVMEFEPSRLSSCLTPEERDGYRERLLGRVKRRNEVIDGEGFAILIFFLTIVAAAVISWLVQRWLDYHFPQSQLDEWRQEIVA